MGPSFIVYSLLAAANYIYKSGQLTLLKYKSERPAALLEKCWWMLLYVVLITLLQSSM